MNKTEAAHYLNIGVRSLERHTSDGRITAQKVKGKTGPALDYDAADLERLKAELEAPPPSPPSPANNALARVPATLLPSLHPRRANSDLAALQGAFEGEVDKEATTRFAVLLDAIEAHRKPRVSLSDKLLLTLDDAQSLTSLSRATLKAAIHSGQLPARRIGRGWKITRKSLEEWVSKL
jgi:excisionase family DNA binding protein